MAEIIEPSLVCTAKCKERETHQLIEGKETRGNQMAEIHRMPNIDFEKESIITQHGIFALLVGTLSNQIQVKYQSMEPSPYDTHDGIMLSFLVALLIYATTSVAEVILRSHKSIYSAIVGNLRLLASGLATILLLVVLAPTLGCIFSVIWAFLFVKLVYESCQQFYELHSQEIGKIGDMLSRFIERVRGRKEEPNLPNVQNIAA